MKLRFQQEELTFEQPIVVESIIEQINNWLGETHYFSHLIIDGEEVAEQPEEALEAQRETMQEVEVVAIEASQFINDLLVSAEEYVKRATPVLEVVAEQFYDAPTEESYLDLNDLFGGLQWLNSMIDVIEQSIVRPENWADVKEAVEPLSDVLQDFEEALNNNDNVLLADLLSYEIKPVFEQVNELVTTIIDTVGERDELH